MFNRSFDSINVVSLLLSESVNNFPKQLGIAIRVSTFLYSNKNTKTKSTVKQAYTNTWSTFYFFWPWICSWSVCTIDANNGRMETVSLYFVSKRWFQFYQYQDIFLELKLRRMIIFIGWLLLYEDDFDACAHKCLGQ